MPTVPPTDGTAGANPAEPDPEPRGGTGGRRRLPPADAWVLALFVAVAFVVAFPSPARLLTGVPGHRGDAFLNLWILRWVEHAAPHGWGRLWDTNAFWPASDTLAYSEALLPEAAVHGLLRTLVRSDVLAFNLVYLGGWTLSMWFTYRLALRVTLSRQGALVAALVYTLATPRLVHYGHFQLSWGFLVPAVLLMAVRFAERPGPRRGAAFGATLAVLTLGSSYYGVMTSVAVAVVLAGGLARRRLRSWRPVVTGLAVAIAVAAVLVAPVAYRYYDLQRDPHFRREAEPASAAHLGDFLAVSQDNYLLGGLPPFEERSRPEVRSVERRLFPGFVGLAFGAAGTALLVRRRGSARQEPARTWLLTLTGSGIVLLVLSFGDRLAVAGREIPLPFGPLREHLPGFSGIRAASRFVALPQLALAVLAALGVAAVAGRLRTDAARWALACGLAALVVAESATAISFAEVPDEPEATAVNEELARRPPAPTVELPIGSPSDGWRWALIEAPRLLLSTIDWNDRVGGYSGFAPRGYDKLAATLETFPSRDALARLDALGVRYVVLRLALRGPLRRQQDPAVARDGVGVYSPSHAREILRALPPERVGDVGRYGDAYLVELTRPE